MLGGDAGDPVDVRLQQAHSALKGVHDDPCQVQHFVMNNEQVVVKYEGHGNNEEIGNHLHHQAGRP